MARNGLTITKLAVQISANDEVAHTLLCLKISLPRDSEISKGGQWNIFNHGSSRLAADPQIYPLPLSASHSHHADQFRTAALLLSLSTETSRSNDQPRSESPTINVTSSGQISLTFDSPTPRRRGTFSPCASSPGGSLGRREFLVVLELEQNVHDERAWRKLAIPLPKCLDNVLRFQVLPPRASSSASTGEISIVTEPKVLPVPSSTFSTPARKQDNPRMDGKSVDEEGWEDGESLGPEDSDSESEEGGGTWLEGRFQSTESLRLEWSFASTSPQIPSLHLTPRWHARHPFIDVEYEACLIEPSLEAVLPDGWGWSELQIEGVGLCAWSCTDGAEWDAALSASSAIPDPDVSDITDRPDDSFATIRTRRNLLPTRNPTLLRSSSGASLMRQPLPQLDPNLDEFSFELSATPVPTAPLSLRKSTLLPVDKPGPQGVSLSRPAPGRLFDLTFLTDVEERSVRVTGKLVPLSKTLLVSPSVPIVIPVFRLGDGDSRCHLTPDPSIIDIDEPPFLTWTDLKGPIRAAPASAVSGEITVGVKRSQRSTQMTVSFPWPRRGAEVGLWLPGDKEDVRVVRAEVRGRAMPKAVLSKSDGVEVRLGKGEGSEGVCTLVLEVDSEDWGLPVFEGATGRLTVDLKGKGWDNIQTNLHPHGVSSYSTTLPPSSPITFAHNTPIPHLPTLSPRTSHFRAVWSWSTLINMFMLYLLLSLGQQVQRLRSEVVFVREEANDIRAYGQKLEERVTQAGVYSWERGGSKAGVAGEDIEAVAAADRPGRSIFTDHKDDLTWGRDRSWDQNQETAPGRVVLGHTGWDWGTWAKHPTLVSLSKSLGWMWKTVVWLVHA